MTCSSVVEHPLMVQWVTGSIPQGGPTEIFPFSQCSTTGVTKDVGDDHICGTRLDVFRRAPRRILNFSVSKVSFLYETKVYYLYYIVVRIGAYFKTFEDHIWLFNINLLSDVWNAIVLPTTVPSPRPESSCEHSSACKVIMLFDSYWSIPM